MVLSIGERIKAYLADTVTTTDWASERREHENLAALFPEVFEQIRAEVLRIRDGVDSNPAREVYASLDKLASDLVLPDGFLG